MQQSPDCCLDANCPFSIALTDALPDFLSEDDHNNTRSNQDVKIPCGVSVLQVQRIAVTLQFRHLVEKTNPGLLDVPTDNMDMSFEVILDDHHNLHDDSLLLNDQVYAELEENVGEGKHILTGEPQLSPSFGDEDALLIGEDEYIITPFHTPDMSPFSSQESVLPHLTYPDDAPEYDFAPKVAIPAGTARLLTDVAMRTLIGGGQAIPTDGIQLLRPLPRHTVAALMPLLFSPNFSSVCPAPLQICPLAHPLADDVPKISLPAHHNKHNHLAPHNCTITRFTIETGQAYIKRSPFRPSFSTWRCSSPSI